MTKIIKMEEIRNLQQTMTDAKGNVITSKKKAAKILLQAMRGKESSEEGNDYIIVADGEIVTIEEAKVLLEQININNANPEERTYLATKRYIDTTVKEYYDADIKAGLKSSPWITLWDSYQKFLAKKISLLKFSDATQKLNALLETTKTQDKPYDKMVNEAKKVAADRWEAAAVKTGIRTGQSINQIAEPIFKKGKPEKYQVEYASIPYKDMDGVIAFKWLEKVFITDGKFIILPQIFTSPSRHFLHIIDDTQVNRNYIIKCNIGSENNMTTPKITISNITFESEIPAATTTKNKEMNAGHFFGGKMQVANLANKYNFLKEIAKTGKNPFTGEDAQLGWEGLGLLLTFIENYEDAEAIDKISGSYSLENIIASNQSPGKLVLDPFIKEAKKLGAKEILIIEAKAVGNVVGVDKKIVKTTYEYTSQVVWYAEYARFNQIKGGTQSARINRAEKVFFEMMILLLSEGGMYTEDSPSMFSELVMASLIDILSPLLDPLDKKKLIKDLLNKRKSTKRVFYKHKLTKPKGLIDLDKISLLAQKEREQVIRDFRKVQNNLNKAMSTEQKIASKKSKIRKLVNKYNPLASSKVNPLSIIESLNSTIREDVINQMSSDTLVNRTGKFASSARVIGANIPSEVTFTYEKDPYSVFSTARGRSPWNSNPDRDPGSIIRQAIKSSMDKRFPGIFKPTVKVVER